MEIPARFKSKNKKSAPKAKALKKRKSDGPTCSMFLAEITRKLALKKKQAELSKNIVQAIINSLTNALPIKFSKRASLEPKESAIKIETLQTYAPELLPNDTINVPHPTVSSPEVPSLNIEGIIKPKTKSGFKMPKMPLVSSDIFKLPDRSKIATEEVAVNTGGDHDVATEIAKHVSTLRRISLIAEEFNQKTAKNLKEIVDSVQNDLIKKLEELQAEKEATPGQS